MSTFLLHRRCIYAELQDFVQLDLRDLLRRAVKKNLDIVKMIVMSVREMFFLYLFYYRIILKKRCGRCASNGRTA